MSMVRGYLIQRYLRDRLRKKAPMNIGPLPRPPGVHPSQFLNDPPRFHSEHIEHRRLTATKILELRRWRKPMTIGYKVPVSDIVLAWEEQKQKCAEELHAAIKTQRELKEKDVEDSCVNGKVESARRNIEVLTLQIKYINRDDDVYLMDHEMLNIFGSSLHIGGPTMDAAATERRY